MEAIKIIELNKHILVGEYNPGNGTNYKAIAVKWPSGANFNYLGCIYPEGWLVINCNTCLAYLFQRKKMLADPYIQEKLGGAKEDYPYFGDLVRKLISREKVD
jgi:hypothetical protein